MSIEKVTFSKITINEEIFERKTTPYFHEKILRNIPDCEVESYARRMLYLVDEDERMDKSPSDFNTHELIEELKIRGLVFLEAKTLTDRIKIDELKKQYL